jgi:hypothetical protein
MERDRFFFPGKRLYRRDPDCDERLEDVDPRFFHAARSGARMLLASMASSAILTGAGVTIAQSHDAWLLVVGGTAIGSLLLVSAVVGLIGAWRLTTPDVEFSPVADPPASRGGIRTGIVMQAVGAFIVQGGAFAMAGDPEPSVGVGLLFGGAAVWLGWIIATTAIGAYFAWIGGWFEDPHLSRAGAQLKRMAPLLLTAGLVIAGPLIVALLLVGGMHAFGRLAKRTIAQQERLVSPIRPASFEPAAHERASVRLAA